MTDRPDRYQARSRKPRDWAAFALAVSAAAALSGDVGVAPVSAASTTTAPGVLVNFEVIITDAKVTIVARPIAGQPPGKYVGHRGSSALFPRGALIRFICKNRGTNAYLPALRFQGEIVRTAPRVVPPGSRVDLNVNFAVRGRFQLEALLNRKQHARPVQIRVY